MAAKINTNNKNGEIDEGGRVSPGVSLKEEQTKAQIVVGDFICEETEY